MRSTQWLVGSWLVFGLGSAAHAEPAEDEPVAVTAPAPSSHILELRARLLPLRAAVAREPAVRTAVEQAELGLKTAQLARQQGNESRALWAEQLAEAATSLAERRLSLAQERIAMRAAEARRQEAMALVQSAREARLVASKRAAAEQP